jgi:ATP-dependent Zn protease
MERAQSLEREHHDAVQAVADALLAKDVISADEVITIATAHGMTVRQPLSTAA